MRCPEEETRGEREDDAICDRMAVVCEREKEPSTVTEAESVSVMEYRASTSAEPAMVRVLLDSMHPPRL